MKNQVLLPGLLAVASGAYLLRRLGQRWGATDEEVHRAMPGDELIPHPMMETTHAITVQASADEIWPWLVQMGMDRGGWYSDPEWWDSLAERVLWSFLNSDEKTGYSIRDEPSADRIIGRFQDLKVGDVMLDGPPGTAFFTVAAMEKNRTLALYSNSHVRYIIPQALRDNPNMNIHGEFSWVFILDQINAEATRLILRTRINYWPRMFRVLTRPFYWPIDFVLARKTLWGVKWRVEKRKQELPERGGGVSYKYVGEDEPIAQQGLDKAQFG
ncbi:MAG TPA: hypothetical protein VED37_15015 [Ktedonobacteraceae bacterium]|nr:hypothetical protein [Ktedonobacteraceae bacterium]